MMDVQINVKLRKDMDVDRMNGVNAMNNLRLELNLYLNKMRLYSVLVSRWFNRI